MSFRRQLLMTFSLGMVALALIASLTTAWISTHRTRELLLAQGLQITDNLAQRSVLALLYGSREIVGDSVQATLAFPGAEQVVIFDAGGEVLVDQGRGRKGLALALASSAAEEGARLSDEDGEAWHFLAPVYSPDVRDESSLSGYAMEKTQRELLGHVYVVMSKSGLREMQFRVFTTNIGVALLFAALLVAVLNLILRRLTRPLQSLAGVMQRAEAGERGVAAAAEGPQEVVRIAEVFNNMMLALEERDRRLRIHNELLESEVEVRTRELVAARDVALAASRHKSEFLANVTHELRTPLQAIIGYTDVVSEALQEQGLDRHLEDMARIMRSAEHLLRLINEVLDLAKIEAGRMEMRLEPVRLEEVVREAAATVLPLAKRNGNRLETVVEDEGGEFPMDRSRLLQVLLNLISNAAKFTENGLISVTALRSPELLRIRVADSGVGMTPEQQAVVFEQFRQLEGGARRRFEGSGLGLAITRQLCHLMGGEVTVQSEPGMGSTFTVTIPLPLAAAREGSGGR